MDFEDVKMVETRVRMGEVATKMEMREMGDEIT